MTLAIKNAAQLVCVCRQGERVRQGSKMGELCVIPDGAVLIRDARITWVGPSDALPRDPGDVDVIDATGKTVLPGLIDSHTHLVFAGTREEFRGAGEDSQVIRASGIEHENGRIAAVRTGLRQIVPRDNAIERHLVVV